MHPEEAHTPLPWFVESCHAEKKHHKPCWCACITHTPGNDSMDGCVCQYGCVSRADAEFIVRAVNAHDDLVAACREALEYANMMPGGMHRPAFEGMLRAALQKAGGNP